METTCQECGMPLDDPNEYHPYAACLMFKGCHNSRKVRVNMDSVMAHGLMYHNPEADRLAAIERQVLWRTEDMPPDAVAWWKRTWGNGEMECRYMNEDGDELHPEAPDHLPDDPVGPLFLPILDPPEGS